MGCWVGCEPTRVGWQQAGEHTALAHAPLRQTAACRRQTKHYECPLCPYPPPPYPLRIRHQAKHNQPPPHPLPTRTHPHTCTHTHARAQRTCDLAHRQRVVVQRGVALVRARGAEVRGHCAHVAWRGGAPAARRHEHRARWAVEVHGGAALGLRAHVHACVCVCSCARVRM